MFYETINLASYLTMKLVHSASSYGHHVCRDMCNRKCINTCILKPNKCHICFQIHLHYSFFEQSCSDFEFQYLHQHPLEIKSSFNRNTWDINGHLLWEEKEDTDFSLKMFILQNQMILMMNVMKFISNQGYNNISIKQKHS